MELLFFILVAYIMLPDPTAANEEKGMVDKFKDFKRIFMSLLGTVLCKYYAFFHTERLARVGLELLSTLALSYWILGSYYFSIFTFLPTLALLLIPFIPIERMVEPYLIDDMQRNKVKVDPGKYNKKYVGIFWPN